MLAPLSLHWLHALAPSCGDAGGLTFLPRAGRVLAHSKIEYSSLKLIASLAKFKVNTVASFP